MTLVDDGYHAKISLEDLAEELPENSPRFIILSYTMTLPDGRKPNRLLLISYRPQTTAPEMGTLHATALNIVENIVKPYRIMSIEDAETELTQELIEKQLK